MGQSSSKRSSSTQLSQIQGPAPGESDKATGITPREHSHQGPAPRESDKATGITPREHSHIHGPAPGEGDKATGTGPREHSHHGPAPGESDKATGITPREHSQIHGPAPGVSDKATGTGPREHSQIHGLAPGVSDKATGTGPREHSHHGPAPREGNKATGITPREHSQIHGPAPREGNKATGITPREHSQIHGPAPREGNKATGITPREHSQIHGPAPREGNKATGITPREHSQIHGPAPREGNKATGITPREHSQIHGPAPREGNKATGITAREHSQIHGPAPREGNKATGITPREHSQIHGPAPGVSDKATGTGPREHSHHGPAPREGNKATGITPREHSRIHGPAPREGNKATGITPREHSQIQGPAPRESDKATGTGPREHSQIQGPAPGESDKATGTGPREHSQIQGPAPRESDKATGTGPREHSQIQGPAPRESDKATGTGPREHSQIQGPAPGESDKATGTGPREHSQIQGPAPRESDKATGTGPREHSQIQGPAPRESDKATGTGPREHSHQGPAPGEGDKATGTVHQNLGSPVTTMAEGSNSSEVTKRIMSKDPNATIREFLTDCSDSQLFKLTKFYRDRLEQAMEGGVDGVSSLLTYKRHFSGQEHRKVTELTEKGNLADSSKLLLKMVMGKGSGAQKVMWGAFVNMRHGVPMLDRILREVQDHGFFRFDDLETAECLSDVSKQLRDVQQKHKDSLRVQTETLRVNTILIKEKVRVFQLLDRYAELTVIPTVRDRTLVEHELLARGRDHEEWTKKHLQRELEKIRTEQLFQSKSKSGISAAVSGVTGIGKTTLVQKIVHDWATGKIYPHFQFVFSFKFRDLNVVNDRINLRNLILNQYPYFGNILRALWKTPEVLLFIFDGLDEFKDRIDFADNRRNTEPQHRCTDPEDRCKVSDIVYSLIQHKLLPGCSVLVTSRPTALQLLEKAEISVWAEILGFFGEERKEFFNKFFDDQTVAAAVIKHVEENVILYTMSYNPSYCWILGLSLGPFFTQRDRKQQRVPKTITQLYSQYIYNILKNHGREIESPRDVLLKLGEMAFTGVTEKKIVFRDGDLVKYNLQPSQFLSGFRMELLEGDVSAQSVVYTFPHLTIQEFVAALAQFLAPPSADILKLLRKSRSKQDGRFEIFLRFVAGLSSPNTARPLEEFLGKFLQQTTCRVIDWVKEKVEGQIGNIQSETGKRDLLNTLHYLFESQNTALARATVGSVETLTLSGLTMTLIDCAILSHVIGLCDTIKHLNLENCSIQCEGLQRLGHVLHKCRLLRLGRNEMRDSGAKLLSAALRVPDCKIQELWLNDVGLTDSCAEDLTSALSTNRSLTVLNLSNNKLGDSGVKLLSAALRDPYCKIQELWLGDVGLSDSCAENLASALGTNCSLTVLNLSLNKLEDSGVKLLSAALSDPDCKIQELQLVNVGLTDSCAEDLDSALGTNHSLTVLNLGSNSFTERSLPALRRLILTCRSLERIVLAGNTFSSTGQKQLRSLQGIKRGLRVYV
uniref:NACHT, LRR and PYD domains-containing protein 12-like n=1 Tax=Pristiophorus japonicus TaxID=55135 RepID=UPI00398EAE92